MKFIFVGDQGSEDLAAENPSSVTMFGVTFELNGEPQEIEDSLVITRLRGNSHFKEVGVENLGAGSGKSAGRKRGRPRKKAAGKRGAKAVQSDESGSAEDQNVAESSAA